MNIAKTLLIAGAMLAATAANAQQLKFAHIDTQTLVSQLPEKIEAETKLQEEAKKLEDQLQVMNSDLQKKYEEYINERETLPELIRATKEKEIQDAGQRIESYTQMAQQSLAQKEQQLLGPIIEKVTAAIDAVGQENGFIYIFDTSSQVILYHSDQSVDAAPMVKAKLGL